VSDQRQDHERMAHWDHKLPKSILSDYELNCLPYAISSYLHHCSGIPACDAHHGGLCAMCGNAVRLVVQAAEPKIIDATITRMARAVGRSRIDIDPPYRGED
jgi:hypothetical protein